MSYQLNVFTGTLDRVNSSSGGSGTADSLTNADGATLTLTPDSSPFGQGVVHIPPGIELDTTYIAAHNLNFYAGANSDALGAYAPSFALSEAGPIIISTNNPATSGNNTFQILAEDGFYLSKDGANTALIKTDLLTSGHTYQFPDSGGTLIVSVPTPASAASSGNPGDISWDSDYMYVCVATDTWKRTALSTW